MEFITNASNHDRAWKLHVRFKRLGYHPFVKPARYGTVYLWVHGQNGTVGIRIGDHPGLRPVHIIRPGGRLKFSLDLDENLSDAKVEAFSIVGFAQLRLL